MRGWAVRVGALAVTWGIGATASAGAPSLEVQWSAPESCPRERFVDALGRHLAGSRTPAVRVAAEVVQDGDTWRIETTLDEGRTPRRFAGRSCEAVVDAAALATAIAIDPLHVEDGPADVDAAPVVPAAIVPEPSAIPTRSTVGTSQVTTPRVATQRRADRAPPTRRPPARRRTRAIGWAALALDGGALPGVGLGPALGLGVVHGALRAEVLGSWRAPVRVRALEDPQVGATIDLLEAGLRLCGVVRPTARLELPWCGGVDVGRLRGRGFGLEESRSASLWWTALVGATGVHWRVIDRLALFARAEAVVPLRHHAFAIAGLATLDRVSPVSGRGLLGVEVRLP